MATPDPITSDAMKYAVDRARLANAMDPHKLRLILLPTERCNFRCVYCYEDFAIGRMSPRTIGAVKALLRNRVADLNELSVGWFGGEPLLASDICLDISQYAHELAGSHQVKLTGSLTTNAWHLDVPMLRRLVAVGQTNYQITLDGDRDAHDTTRLLANGKGTFARIWDNLCAMSSTDMVFAVSLRLHVTPANLQSMERLVPKLNSVFRGDSRYSVLFHKVSDLGGPSAGRISVLTRDEYDKRVASLRGGCDLTSTSEHLLSAAGSVCYAAKANSFVIRANGRLAKCTVALADERNDVGYIRDDGTMQLYADKVRAWMHGFEDFDQQTLSCPLSTLTRRIRQSGEAALATAVT